MKRLPNLTDVELKAHGFNEVEISIWHILTAKKDGEKDGERRYRESVERQNK